MKKDLEPNPIELDVLQAERLVKEPMRQTDPGKMDFTEEYFNQLHNKIMAQVDQTEIQPKLTEKPGSLPKLLRLWWTKASPKANPPLMAFILMVLTGALLFQSLGPTANRDTSANTQDLFLAEAMKSPEAFEAMVAGSLGQSDFLVDVASRNFDHLNLHDFEDLFGTSSVGFSGNPTSSQQVH